MTAPAIRVFQCKDDCCLVQVPSKRFWYVKTIHHRDMDDVYGRHP